MARRREIIFAVLAMGTVIVLAIDKVIVLAMGKVIVLAMGKVIVFAMGKVIVWLCYFGHNCGTFLRTLLCTFVGCFWLDTHS